MNVPLLLGLVGLILALVDELQAEGKSLVGWAVVFLAIATVYSAGGLRL